MFPPLTEVEYMFLIQTQQPAFVYYVLKLILQILRLFACDIACVAFTVRMSYVETPVPRSGKIKSP